MKSIVSPTLILNLSHSPFPHLRPTFLRSYLLLLHSAAGDDPYRRRIDGSPAPSSYSPSSFISSPSLSRRNYDEENRNVKITVWWDFENCNIPVGVNVHRVSSRITWAIRSSGIKGPVTITAFGDVAQLSRSTQEALTSTGVCLTHVPCSGKNSSDRSFMADIVYWVYQNPPPAHFFLISGDKDFANILHRLRMSNYNILLASTDTASGVLCSAATIMWPWNGLVRGENVTVRHFNHPPDGLYGSWYGHYKGVLDDPFAYTDHPTTTSQPEEYMEPISESKPRPIPKVVVNAIRQVLHSYPEGISLTELRSELKRNNITMDKDFFGYKKFSLFLASLSFLKFVPSLSGDRQPVIVSSLKKGAEQPDIRPRSSKEVYTNGIYKDNGFIRKGDLLMDKTSISNENPLSCKDRNLDANSSASILSKVDHSVVDLEACKGDSVTQSTILDPSDASQQRDSIAAKDGLLKKLWKTLLGHRAGSALNKDDNILVVDSSRHEESSKNAPNVQSSDLSKKMKKKDEVADPNNLFFKKESFEIHSLDAEKSIEKSNYVREQKVGLFGMILRWSKSWIYGANEQDDHFDSKVNQIDAACRSGKASPFSSTHTAAAHELFSKTHFWDELESFLLDPKGCHLISKSRTREQLLRRLQNEGPTSLKQLNINDLSHLVDILLLEKKWLEESTSQKFPFSLLITSKKKSLISQPSHSNGITKSNSEKLQEEQNQLSISTSENGTKPPCNLTELRSWFQKTFGSNNGKMEPEEFQKLFENNFNTKLCSSTYGYSNIRSLITACSTGTTNAPEKKTEPPSREEVISHCQHLLNELLEKNPTGFNISIFQPEFVRKYCYILDYKTLGYPKLVTLLQIMPGITIENSFIRPSKILHYSDVIHSNGEDEKGKEALMEDDRFDDSAWDELGPLSNHPVDEDGKDYSPVSLSDDEYTDSEEDVPLPSRRLGSRQGSLEDSSLLLKILDSWEFRKEEDGKEKQRDINGLVDCSMNGYQKHSNNGVGLQKWKLRDRGKRFSFVTRDEDDKGSFAERILGEVKKAGDLRLKG